MRSAATLAGLCLAFGAVFFVQRGRSVVLQIEAERPLAERVAGQADLSVAEVMSLRELLGADRNERQLLSAAEQFARLRTRWGDDLAVLVVSGHPYLAQELWRESGEDPKSAAGLLRPRPEGILAVRFAEMAERYAARLPN